MALALAAIGYKTPISLLQERCQKAGWERPFVDPKQGTTPGSWTASVTLRRKHPKKPGELETVYMRPPPPPSQIAVEKGNAMEAKHWVAVYALFRFANNLRLNMQLPPATRGAFLLPLHAFVSPAPCRARLGVAFRAFSTDISPLRVDYWAALEKEKAASTPNKQWLWSTTPFETAAAAPLPPSAAPAASPAGSNGSTSARPPRNGSPLVNLSSSSTPSASRSSTPAPLPKSWAEAPEVRMPSALRDLVERTIRDALPDLASLELDSGSAAVDDHAPEPDDGAGSGPGSGAATPTRSPAEAALEAEFTALGFRRGHVLRALAYVRSGSSSSSSGAAAPSRNDVLAHLHLLVPESDLPAAFRDARPADATIRNATSRDAAELGRMWQAERVAREVGAPVEWVRVELEGARAAVGEGARDDELEGMVVDVLARRLMDVPLDAEEDEREKLGEDALRASWVADAGAGPSRLSQEEKDELRQRRDDELLGLEGLFGARFRRSKDGVEIAVPHKGDRVSLRVLFHPSSSYPSPHSPPGPAALPSFFIASPTLPPYIRLHLHTLLASQFRPSVAQDGAAWLDLAEAGYGGVVGEMVSFLEQRVRSAIEHPPDAREVMDRLVPPAQRPSATLGAGAEGARRVTKTQQAQRRGGPRRLRASPEQQEALKRAHEELSRSEGYRRMLEGRKRLPAWSMRDKIVELIRNERVVIVCGETGSGKTTQGASLSPSLFLLARPLCSCTD